MRERPILMSGPMVRALLSGQKTQTRRVVRLVGAEHAQVSQMVPPDPAACSPAARTGWTPIVPAGEWPRPVRCPFGIPGDRLWVREAWALEPDWDEAKPSEVQKGDSLVWWRADGPTGSVGGRWRPSIHMPRWACRLVLEVEQVRVERVQDITIADAIAEGVAPAVAPGDEDFATLWDEINAGRGYGWEANPWCWCLTFRRLP